MLALVVAEDLRDGRVTLDATIPVSAAAVATPGSGVYLKKGEAFPLDQMMTAVLVRSANNAGVAVAESLAGSEPAFVERMNALASALGMEQTTFRSVTGLPRPPGESPDVTSAFDMAVLARRVVQYPEILRWTSIKTAPFRNGKITIRSTNRLLFEVPGTDGLKTGFTLSAGFNLVATGTRDGVRVVSVVLNSKTSSARFAASARLVRLGFAARGRSVPGENLPAVLPDPETVAVLSGGRSAESASGPPFVPRGRALALSEGGDYLPLEDGVVEAPAMAPARGRQPFELQGRESRIHPALSPLIAAPRAVRPRGVFLESADFPEPRR